VDALTLFALLAGMHSGSLRGSMLKRTRNQEKGSFKQGSISSLVGFIKLQNKSREQFDLVLKPFSGAYKTIVAYR